MDKNKQSAFVPFGSLNQDDSIVTPLPTPAGIKSPFELGDYRYALNLRIGSSRSNNFGDAENLKGTDQVATYILTTGSAGSPPAGTNKTIGKLEDYEFQCVYMFNWNSNNNDTITRWDISTNTIYELLRLDLKWESSYFVKAAKLDNWMAFTDRNNNPRLIDVNTITALFNTYGASNFREFHISHHKWSPVIAPFVRVYYDGVNNNYEKLKNKAYQFSYQYIYKGNLKSRFSPISKTALTTPGATILVGMVYTTGFITSIEVDIPGMILDVPNANTQYNYFDHTDTKFTMAVESIVLAYREGELDLWKIWKTVPMSSFTRLQYFNGDANNTILSQEDFIQPFDTVPFKAGTVEAIDNRFVYGDCLNEQTILNDLVVTNLAVVTDPTNDWREDITPSSFTSLSAPLQADLRRINSLSQFSFKSRAKYKVCIQYLHHSGWRSLGYTTDDFQFTAPETSIFRILAFNFKIDAAVKPPDWAVAYQIMRTNAMTIDMFVEGIANQFIPLIDSVDTITERLAIPDNVKQVIRDHFANSKLVSSYEAADFTKKAIQNEIDARNRSYKNDTFNKVLDFNEAVGFGSATPELALSNHVLNKTLRHNPIKGDLTAEIYKVTNTTTLADCSRIMIDINNWYNAAKISSTKDQPTINKLYYNFRNGDRVRFLGSDVAVPSSGDKKYYDVPIISFTGKGLLIERPKNLLWLPDSTSTSSSDFQIEVYTPKVPGEEDFVFYETGEVYPILYPGTASRDFAKRDWTYVNNASVTGVTYGPWNIYNKLPFYYGDVQSAGRTIFRDTIAGYGAGTIQGSVSNSMNPDPEFNYDYWDHYNGRPTVTYKDIPPATFFTTQCRFGGKIVERSLINQLNRYKAEDQFIYPSEYGRIRNLINTANAQVESVGSILLAIGERESWSIYVNRTTIEDLSGKTQVSLSNQVLGSYNTLLGSQGTLNPESVSVYGGRVYWWNAIKGSWVRYGRDGLTAISDYKMRNWFREISDLLITKYLTSEMPLVLSCYDSFNEELITYISHSSLPSTFRGYDTYKGIMFSEKDTGWKSVHSFTPEMFARMNNQVVSMKGGLLYTHETSNTYNTFYGVKYDSKIEPVFNDNYFQVKHWETVTILSTNKWSVERILSEYRGLRALIQSRITTLEQIDEREDAYWAAIKRNINTPNVTDPIINGDPVRCKAIQVLFTLDPAINYLSLLHSAMAGYTDSPINP